eukprot:1356453-Amorphochlora_amoeboformis.AAC.1
MNLTGSSREELVLSIRKSEVSLLLPTDFHIPCPLALYSHSRNCPHTLQVLPVIILRSSSARRRRSSYGDPKIGIQDHEIFGFVSSAVSRSGFRS